MHRPTNLRASPKPSPSKKKTIPIKQETEKIQKPQQKTKALDFTQALQQQVAIFLEEIYEHAMIKYVVVKMKREQELKILDDIPPMTEDLKPKFKDNQSKKQTTSKTPTKSTKTAKKATQQAQGKKRQMVVNDSRARVKTTYDSPKRTPTRGGTRQKSEFSQEKKNNKTQQKLHNTTTIVTSQSKTPTKKSQSSLAHNNPNKAAKLSRAQTPTDSTHTPVNISADNLKAKATRLEINEQLAQRLEKIKQLKLELLKLEYETYQLESQRTKYFEKYHGQ